MAIDYIIGGLQLLSAAVNVLALGSFWVTPGLRTTANRFVINLLVVNVIGCLALTPALWLHGGLRPKIHSEIQPIYDGNDESIALIITAATSNIYESNQHAVSATESSTPSFLRDENGVNIVRIAAPAIQSKLKCSETSKRRCETAAFIEQETADGVVTAIFADDNDNSDNRNSDDNVEIMIEDIRDEEAVAVQTRDTSSVASSLSPTKNVQYSDCTRFWGFDLVAALGGLSVMLVVGDTWCAVTDPLRYHSRISGLKSWILIAATWFVSILFCIASALRRDCRLITTEITSTLQGKYWSNSAIKTPTTISTTSTTTIAANADITTSMTGDSLEFDDIYNFIYSCTFFVVIILLPICLVCAMYWKIFSEARQNGLRMRQNGSSPLLQSALNLATASAQLPTTQLDHCCTVIGEEDSDNPIESITSSRCTVMQTLRRNSAAATSPSHHVIKNTSFNLNDNQSISMKLHLRASVHQPHSRYLEIPKFNDILNYRRTQAIQNEVAPNTVSNSTDFSSYESPAKAIGTTLQRQKCVFSSRQLMLMEQHNSHAYGPMKMDVAGELRQVHSTPDLQKSIDAELIAAGHQISAANCSGKKIHSTGSIHTNGDRPSLAHRTPSICAPPKALSYMTSIRHRLSNASSIFKYREESRAARISILVVIMFLFSYFPYGLLVLLQGRVTFFTNSSFLGVLFLLIANMSSPFIFAYRNRRVRRGVCRLFGVDAKTNERLQKQRILMRNTLHAGSCRDRKQKTKIVRIDRNSTKSSSFSSNAAVPCKYTAIAMPSTDGEHNIKHSVESAVFLDTNRTANVLAVVPDANNYYVIMPTAITATDNSNEDADDLSELYDDVAAELNDDQNLVAQMCCNRDQSSPSNECVEENVTDISSCGGKTMTNDQNRNPNNSKSNNNNNNNCSKSKTNSSSGGCNNSGTTTGANVIKQKISLLKRVCKTSRKLSNCTTNASPFYFVDGNNTTNPVNV